MKAAILIIGALIEYSFALTTSQTVLSPFLRDCYSESWLVNRNHLPPMILPVMLDIIRKIEDHPGSIGDMRQISTGIIHMFRQDGIVYEPTVATSPNIIPYSPTGFPAYKNRLLLTKLLPNNQFSLPHDWITPYEKCALHHMVSSSLHINSRGDEEWTCDSLTATNRRAQIQQYQKSQDIEIFNVSGAVDIRGRQIVGLSRCPIETGVVSTRWGDISMGPVVTGIACGLEEQNVLVTDLVTLRSGFSSDHIVVNNRYTSTISGDIAEAAIRQGTSRQSITIGATGGWNSTNVKRHYFVNRNDDLEMTDAEIRGGLDGLVLSELGNSYANTFPELKLSQLIDMFYSDNGVFHEHRFRACNRKVLVPDIASRQILIEKSIGPAIALYHLSSLTATVQMGGLQNFINNTVDAFQNYIPQNVNDPICTTSNDQVMRPKINLIFIAEPTTLRSQQISYIVDQIEVGKFGCSITLIHPQTGEVVIEKTFSIAQFYQELAENLVSQTGSLDLVRVLESLRRVGVTELDKERSHNYSGGNATVALFLLDMIPLSTAERIQAIGHSQWIRTWLPDLRLIFASNSANEDTVGPMIRHYSDFIPVTFPTTVTADVSNSMSLVVEHLRHVPRRIVNPLCDIQWMNVDPGTIGFADYVDADGTNLYSLIPNYFYENNPLRLLRIESTDDGGPLSVCYSRTNIFPRRNRTNSVVPDDVVCESVANGGLVEISLANACDGASSISSCPPLYITVSSTTIPGVPQCKDFGCRYPNDVKYLVVTHELGCYSCAVKVKIHNILVVLVSTLSLIYFT